MSLSEKVLALLAEQKRDWNLAENNYKALEQIRTRVEKFGEFHIRIQFNPARIASSAAKTDTVSIQERKCFLCPQNLPPEQKGIPFGKEYQILVNPFPIFPEHFTIPTLLHRPQAISGRFGDMLKLAEQLERFVVFYNGPESGASAPDHMHFQAGNKSFLPIEKEWRSVESERLCNSRDSNLYLLKDYLRTTFIIESSNKEELSYLFDHFYHSLEIKSGSPEPKFNIVMWYEKGKWVTCIFPREKHRPSSYYAEGEKNILISPGAVDMGGTLVVPLEKDFIKITATDIKNLYKEVSLNEDKTLEVVKRLKECL